MKGWDLPKEDRVFAYHGKDRTAWLAKEHHEVLK